MPFGHKPHRQAVLFALALAFIMSCQVLLNAPDKSAVVLVVYPTAATLQPDQVQDFTAVGLTVAGDTASIAVTWSATGGTVDTNSVGGRHYGHYHNASCGQYTVTATSEPGTLTASASVTIACAIPVATVTVSPASVSLQMGQSSQLTATPKDANGNPLTGRAITWSSSNTAIATVSGTGLVTGVAGGGPVTITATSEGQSGSASVTVTTVPVASVTVTPPSASVQVGQTVQLTATLKDANGNILTGRTVTWSSNQTTVATVNATGRVTARAAGSATITATSEGQSGTSSITVTPVPVASVTVTPASASVAVGATVQLTATPKDANGNPLTGRVITWSSSNTAIATVSGSGLVTGVAAGGPVTITATSEGRSGSAAVTVTTASAGRFGHVIIVAEENHDYSSVIGNAAMPYLNGLSTQYGLATNYYANAHPSIGNYFELTVGDTIINDDNFTGTVSNDNIIRELVNAGRTWKAYIEGYPSYDANHVPMSYFSDIRNNPAQAANMVPFTRFATDLANGTLPDFSFITPNICNDAHDCSLGTADSWLQTNIDPLIQSARFQQDGLLVIWWDESASSSTNGGGKVAWTVVSPFAKRGYKSTTFYQHQSTLRLMLRALGVSTYPGDAASAPDMSEFFTTGFPTNRGFTTHPQR